MADTCSFFFLPGVGLLMLVEMDAGYGFRFGKDPTNHLHFRRRLKRRSLSRASVHLMRRI